MITTPIDAAGREFAEAYLEIISPAEDQARIPFKFNPAEYQLNKANTYAEIAIPGLESPPLQWIRGGAETLSMEVLVDTSDSLKDVRAEYVDRLRALLSPNEKLHAPPIVRFHWDGAIFDGVLENLGVGYTLFDPKGVPLRAKLTIAMKEYRPVAVQVRETRKQSADVDKSWTVTAGDTLDRIAYAVYRDPAQWRVLAEANGITDPRFLEPGRQLDVPSLRRNG
ncbi:LysM peptidoglycan-binding domain-containing protein [Nonomuraea sp. NPDC050153]|uniref:CIS tube protein n=1 Tax=Nonomuraea sp. NPDC050153 TaxID=3364359 RepID=UPI0037BBD231